MSTYTDRCHAVTAALQDLARDLEADLGKLARTRGTTEASTDRLAHLRDPGPDVATFERQKNDHPSTRTMTVGKIVDSYRAAADTAKAMVHHEGPEGADLVARTAVYDLVAAIQGTESHDDAIALVATFTEE